MTMITLGYDVGTRFVKTCIVENENILGASVSETGGNIKKTIDETTQAALKAAGLKKRKIKSTCATGYGANFVKRASYAINEEVCIAKAAYRIDKNIKTVIDTGGLFINVASLNGDGTLEDATQNDKCAAGSGKFLEIISEAVRIPISSISESALKSSTPYALTNSCAVFAESEVITQVNAGTDSSDIIAGIIYSIASKIETLVNRIEAKDKMAVVGGVAKIDAFRIILEKVLKKEFVDLPIDYQIAAAYGAALYAQDMPVKKFGWFKI